MGKVDTPSGLVAAILTILILLLDLSGDLKLIGVIVIYAALYGFVTLVEKAGNE